MRWHYTITLSADAEEASRRILEHVASDPAILRLDGDPIVLAFCGSESIARLYRDRATDGHPLGRSVGTIELLPRRGVLRVDQTCSDESLTHLAATVRWVLASFPHFQVFDEDATADVTDRVRDDPEWLFR